MVKQMDRFDAQGTLVLKNGAGALIALAACALLAGCGNLTAGGLTGDATVTVSGDAVDAPTAAPQRVIGVSQTAPLAMSGAGPDGEVKVDFFIYLETATGGSTSLSENEIRIRLDVQGRQEVDAVESMVVPATQYSQMRIVFTDIRVDVSDGLIINGVPVIGEVRVELKDTIFTVTRPVNLDIGEGESVFLLLDLNANTWLQAVDPVLKVIAEDVFGDAVSVSVR
jgi:hypothetical protein